VSQGRQDILTTTIGTEEHPSCVRAAGFGVGVRQYFGSTPRSPSSTTPAINEKLSQMRE